MFMLTNEDDIGGKLKTYSANSRAGKHILKLEVEYKSATRMAYDVDGLQKILNAQRPARNPRNKTAAETSQPTEGL